jgi:hypothetical protein
VLLVLLHLQVNYHDDLDWNRWNHAAKKRILLDDENNLKCLVPSNPMGAYYVSKRTVSSAGTLVSSLCSTATASSDIGTLPIRTGEEQEEPAREELEHTFPKNVEEGTPNLGVNVNMYSETVVTATIPENNPAVGHSTLQRLDIETTTNIEEVRSHGWHLDFKVV